VGRAVALDRIPAAGLRRDLVTAMTWVADLRRVQSRRKYRFLRQADQSVLAQGETEWVFVDAATGRPRAIPQPIKALFRVVPDGPGSGASR
jgi:acyl-CoA thioester hydrolase